MVMMVLCPEAGSLAFTPPGDEMSEFPHPHRQSWMSNLAKGTRLTTQWLEVDSNMQTPLPVIQHKIYRYTTTSQECSVEQAIDTRCYLYMYMYVYDYSNIRLFEKKHRLCCQ